MNNHREVQQQMFLVIFEKIKFPFTLELSESHYWPCEGWENVIDYEILRALQITRAKLIANYQTNEFLMVKMFPSKLIAER